MNIQTIYHKKNKIFEEEFFKDKECTEAFDFKNAKDLYIDGMNGDITPLLELHDNIHNDDVNVCVANITAFQILQFGKYICGSDEINGQGYGSPQSYTKYYFLNVSDYDEVFEGYYFDNFTNITPNLSKYIPEDNAVLFLSKDIQTECENSFMPNEIYTYVDNNIEGKSILENVFYYGTRINELQEKITIFLPHGTQSELEKANEVSKYLWGNFGIKPNLCVLHWFDRKYCFDNEFHIKQIKKQIEYHKQEIRYNMMRQGVAKEDLQRSIKYLKEQLKYFENSPFNKIITTNSTGILPVQDNERLQVIDSKEIFEEYLKTER